MEACRDRCIFLLATSFLGQAIGAWFTRPENATLLLLATSLPRFFTAGFAWPREAIPDAAQALGRMFTADTAIDGPARRRHLEGRMTGSASGRLCWSISRSR